MSDSKPKRGGTLHGMYVIYEPSRTTNGVGRVFVPGDPTDDATRRDALLSLDMCAADAHPGIRLPSLEAHDYTWRTPRALRKDRVRTYTLWPKPGVPEFVTCDREQVETENRQHAQRAASLGAT